MKNFIRTTVLFLSLTTLITSCSDDDDNNLLNKPLISNLEIGVGHHDDDGHDHDHDEAVAYIGEDMHLEATIVAEGKIDYIVVEIHDESTGNEVVEATYKGDGITGLKNLVLHEHIDIPATATEGVYHFHIKVVDQQKLATEVRKEITLEKR